MLLLGDPFAAAWNRVGVLRHPARPLAIHGGLSVRLGWSRWALVLGCCLLWMPEVGRRPGSYGVRGSHGVRHATPNTRNTKSERGA